MGNRLWVGALAAAAALPLMAGAAGATTAPKSEKPLWRQSHDYWTTQAAPRVADPVQDARVGLPARRRDAARAATTRASRPPRRSSRGARRSPSATEQTPMSLARKAGAKPVQKARLLTLLAEFDPNANDDFSGWERPDPATGECVTEPAGTTFSGPLHNELPDPATNGSGRDNNTFWVPGLQPVALRQDHLLQAGPHEEGAARPARRRRPARPHRAQLLPRDVQGRLRGDRQRSARGCRLPHSEAWYSADSCDAGEASDVGHPDNPRGTTQMAIDAVEALAAAQPDFPWADFDVEDQGDKDEDGDLFEPDGVLDHVVLVHAGADQADDGGEQGTYAEWSSAQAVDPAAGGHEISGTGLRIFNFTTQAEDAGVGVIAHEYGHDLGLPDLYDVIGPGDTDVAFWDLMSTGSHSGPLFQTIPAHMGAWSKYVLGWVDPVELDYGSRTATLTLGQASRPPQGTADSVKINLPDKHVTLGAPHGGENAWWSNKTRTTPTSGSRREIAVPAGTRRAVLVVERLRDRGAVGLRLHRGLDRRRARAGASSRSTPRTGPWCRRTTTRTATSRTTSAGSRTA